MPCGQSIAHFVGHKWSKSVVFFIVSCRKQCALVNLYGAHRFRHFHITLSTYCCLLCLIATLTFNEALGALYQSHLLIWLSNFTARLNTSSYLDTLNLRHELFGFKL